MRSREHKRHDFLIFSLFLWIIFLSFELIFRVNDFYKLLPIVDVPAHFLSGMAISGTVYFYLTISEKYAGAKKLMSVLATFVTGILWEVAEMTQELIVMDPPHLQDYFFWDGFFDIIVHVSGGIFVFLLVAYILKNKDIKHHTKMRHSEDF